MSNPHRLSDSNSFCKLVGASAISGNDGRGASRVPEISFDGLLPVSVVARGPCCKCKILHFKQKLINFISTSTLYTA